MNQIMFTDLVVNSKDKAIVPEQLPSGTAVLRFNVAEVVYNSKSQEMEYTIWKVVAYGHAANQIAKMNLKHGSQIHLKGRLKKDTYINREGKKVYDTFIELQNPNDVWFKQSPYGQKNSSSVQAKGSYPVQPNHSQPKQMVQKPESMVENAEVINLETYDPFMMSRNDPFINTNPTFL